MWKNAVVELISGALHLKCRVLPGLTAASHTKRKMHLLSTLINARSRSGARARARGTLTWIRRAAFTHFSPQPNSRGELRTHVRHAANYNYLITLQTNCKEIPTHKNLNFFNLEIDSLKCKYSFRCALFS